MKQPGITSVLVGARSPEQVEENVKASAFDLNDEEISLISNELELLRLKV